MDFVIVTLLLGAGGYWRSVICNHWRFAGGTTAGFGDLLNGLHNLLIVRLTFLVNLLDLRGEIFQIVRARAVVRGGLVQLVAQIADLLFERADVLGLRGLRFEHVLDLAG